MKLGRVARALGSILRVFGLFFFLPALGSLIWDDNVRQIDIYGHPMPATGVAFLLTGLTVILLGFVLTSLPKPANEDLREREAYFVVGFGWLLCGGLGALPFLLADATRDPTVALFESMSAITTTGFTALPAPLEQHPASIHLWRGTLHFFGGMGIVLVAVAVLARLTEGATKLFSGESVEAVTRIRPKLTATAKTLLAIYLLLNTLSFTGFLLAIHYTGEALSWKESAFHAAVHASSAIATGGMSTRTDSIAAFDSNAVVYVAIASMIAGATSFPLYYRAFRGDWGAFRRSSEFGFYLLMILAPSIAVVGFLLVGGAPWGYAFLHGPAAVVTSLTTTGLASVSPAEFPDGVKLILVLLMFTGGMVGSTTGAIKLARIQLLLRLVYYELQRLLHPHAVSILKMGGRLVPDDTVRRVVVFFFTYVSVFIAGALGFALLGFDFSSSVVGSAASLGAAGYAWGAFLNGFGEPTSEAARLLGTLLMWTGRLEIFTALLLFVPATYRD